MTKLKLLLTFLIISLTCNSQAGQINQINITNFTVKATLPGTVDSWLSTPGALILTAQKVPGIQLREPMMVLSIRSGPALVCGNSVANPRRIDPFDIRVFNTADLMSMLGNCNELKAGTYTICVQFLNMDKVAISREVCREFRVEETNVDYSPPTLITPENEKKFSLQDLQRPVQFRWTPVIPKPQEPVTYKLRVWQLMQGQNHNAAMRSNQPLVDRDIRDLTQATITNLLTGPCKPPYLCDFVWSVQALNRSGKPIGRNNGTSEPYRFKMNNDIDIQIDSLNIECCKNGKQNITIILKNNLTGAVKITQIKIDKVNGSPANIIPSPLTPALPVTIPGNGSQTFTGQINCIDTAKIIRFWVAAEDPFDNAITETEVESDTLHCRCDACDENNFVMNIPVPAQINTTVNSISFNQNISISSTPPKTIKSIKAELVYFEMIPDNELCIPCNKDASLYGHFTNGTNSQQWNGPQSSLPISINTPLTPCCNTTYRWCIRYKVEFTDCTVCTKLICYEKKKTGCIAGGGGTDNPNSNNPK